MAKKGSDYINQLEGTAGDKPTKDVIKDREKDIDRQLKGIFGRRKKSSKNDEGFSF